MARRLILSAAALMIAGGAVAGDARTTRIEPNAVYGATVTVEEGVRVFRPLPSEQHVIVNPNGTTPLGLGYYHPGTTAGAIAPPAPAPKR